MIWGLRRLRGQEHVEGRGATDEGIGDRLLTGRQRLGSDLGIARRRRTCSFDHRRPTLRGMARFCPACAVAMQPLFLERAGEPDLQLDRCAACGGVWFDAGEAEEISRRKVSWVPSENPTGLRCPGCGDGLGSGRVKGRFSGARCESCHGLWLDEAQLTALGSAKLEALASRAARHGKRPRSAPVVGFLCAACSRRAPWTEANGTAKGLVCRACTPRAVDDPSHGSTILTKSDRLVQKSRDRVLLHIESERTRVSPPAADASSGCTYLQGRGQKLLVALTDRSERAVVGARSTAARAATAAPPARGRSPGSRPSRGHHSGARSRAPWGCPTCCWSSTGRARAG